MMAAQPRAVRVATLALLCHSPLVATWPLTPASAQPLAPNLEEERPKPKPKPKVTAHERAGLIEKMRRYLPLPKEQRSKTRTPWTTDLVDYDEVMYQIEQTERNPGLMDQGMTSLCVPVAFMHILAWALPDEFVEMATHLLTTGKASLGAEYVDAMLDATSSKKGAKQDLTQLKKGPRIRPLEFLTAYVFRPKAAEKGTRRGRTAKWFRSLLKKTNKGEPLGRLKSNTVKKSKWAALIAPLQAVGGEGGGAASGAEAWTASLGVKIGKPDFLENVIGHLSDHAAVLHSWRTMPAPLVQGEGGGGAAAAGEELQQCAVFTWARYYVGECEDLRQFTKTMVRVQWTDPTVKATVHDRVANLWAHVDSGATKGFPLTRGTYDLKRAEAEAGQHARVLARMGRARNDVPFGDDLPAIFATHKGLFCSIGVVENSLHIGSEACPPSVYARGTKVYAHLLHVSTAIAKAWGHDAWGSENPMTIASVEGASGDLAGLPRVRDKQEEKRTAAREKEEREKRERVAAAIAATGVYEEDVALTAGSMGSTRALPTHFKTHSSHGWLPMPPATTGCKVSGEHAADALGEVADDRFYLSETIIVAILTCDGYDGAVAVGAPHLWTRTPEGDGSIETHWLTKTDEDAYAAAAAVKVVKLAYTPIEDVRDALGAGQRPAYFHFLQEARRVKVDAKGEWFRLDEGPHYFMGGPLRPDRWRVKLFSLPPYEMDRSSIGKVKAKGGDDGGGLWVESAGGEVTHYVPCDASQDSNCN